MGSTRDATHGKRVGRLSTALDDRRAGTCDITDRSPLSVMKGEYLVHCSQQAPNPTEVDEPPEEVVSLTTLQTPPPR